MVFCKRNLIDHVCQILHIRMVRLDIPARFSSKLQAGFCHSTIFYLQKTIFFWSEFSFPTGEIWKLKVTKIFKYRRFFTFKFIFFSKLATISPSSVFFYRRLLSKTFCNWFLAFRFWSTETSKKWNYFRFFNSNILFFKTTGWILYIKVSMDSLLHEEGDSVTILQKMFFPLGA